MRANRWEHFEHGADIGVRGLGETPADAFAAAAQAMTAVTTEIERVEPRVAVAISCDAPELDLLFADWLNALITEAATRKMLFAKFDVTISGTYKLTATAWGEPLQVEKHQPAVEVKGATYTCLRTERNEDGIWIAQCVVDV